MGPNWMLTRSSVFLVHNGQFTRPEFSPRKDIAVGMPPKSGLADRIFDLQ